MNSRYINESGNIESNYWYQLIYNGSRREDDISPVSDINRPLNHFYNPVTGGTAWWADNPTPDWALEYSSEGARLGLTKQEYSLADANDYLYMALTRQNLDERKRFRQKYFYSIGHILHLLADMGQPEHVRPDMHPIFEDDDSIKKWLVNAMSNYLGEWSLYEKYTDATISEAISKASSYTPPPITQIRDLWTNAAVGLSDYTNKNFVSEDTNFNSNDASIPLFNDYPLPMALPMSPENDCKPIGALYSESNEPTPTSTINNQPLSGEVCFISNTVYDTNPNEPSITINHRAASLSIFNREADDYHDACIAPTDQSIIFGVDSDCKRYTLNRWNFVAAHDYLIPRIISYGDAFIDHLIRGEMKIERTDITHLGDLHIDTKYNTISQLPLNITNTTQTNEEMGEGTLTAVINYADSDGNITYVITSDIIDNLTPPSQQTAQNYTFKFPNGGFPLHLNGHTTSVQVIFRGKLGDDIDSIVVATKPLNELITTIGVNTTTPSSGVYALVDHLPQVTGFNILKLKLSGNKPLDGVITPVVRHHVNSCYTDDLKGEFNVNGQTRLCDLYTYRSEVSFNIPATQPSTILASSINATGTEHTINLSTPIPFNATDLMVDYFHFPGDPSAPIGVASSDISEPTYISIVNNTDHYAISGTYYSIDEMLAGDMRTFVENTNIYATPLDIDISMNGTPSIQITDLPAGGYSRFAVLTSPRDSGDTFLFSLAASSANFSTTLSAELTGAISQLDSSTNQVSRSNLPVLRDVIGHYYIKLEQPYLGGVVGNEEMLPAIDPANQTAITLIQP